VSYRIKAVLGLVLFALGVVVFERSLYLLMHVGACPAGATEDCPPQPIETSLAIPVGLILVSIGLSLLARLGYRSVNASSAGAACLFVVTGVVALAAGMGARGPGAHSVKSTGIFLAALFVFLGAAFLYQGISTRRSSL
jgi:hypothetical protein